MCGSLCGVGRSWIKSVVVSRDRLVRWRNGRNGAGRRLDLQSGRPGRLSQNRDGTLRVDQYYSAFACLLAAILLTPDNRGALPTVGWRCLAMAWAYSGVGVWLAVSYSQNVPRMFYAGLLGALLLLVTCHWLFQLPSMGAQAVNTLILLLVALPAADLVLRPAVSEEPLAPDGKYYLYETARKDPAGFARWCAACDADSVRIKRAIFTADPRSFA